MTGLQNLTHTTGEKDRLPVKPAVQRGRSSLPAPAAISRNLLDLINLMNCNGGYPMTAERIRKTGRDSGEVRRPLTHSLLEALFRVAA